MRIEDFDLNDRVIAFVKHGIEKADQNVMTLFGTKDFFESIVGFRIYEAHSFCWLFPYLFISISIMDGLFMDGLFVKLSQYCHGAKFAQCHEECKSIAQGEVKFTKHQAKLHLENRRFLYLRL